ncbi:DUF4247 domain-containing protein [Heliobacterium chlorum]|uniref:DUF4247 domain-containing protein n=1 Tax=Heliobacterium chlorum TaxID=2698 RepID=A0ABR7T4J7_HELCL|nr:DUF4247 domain-containing protein [Heliobacterium chlorum]MBC9785002.1 DUF4247 domain-containing protein [Heliobacterium chlorum]
MKKSWMLSFCLIFMLLLTGCGQQKAADFISQHYSLEAAQQDGTGSSSKTYRAAQTPVGEVATAIVSAEKPNEQSAYNDDKMVLLYNNNSIITVTKDANLPQDSLVNVSSVQFVKEHTSSGFWQGYLLGNTLERIFGSSPSPYSTPSYTPNNSYPFPTKSSVYGTSSDSSKGKIDGTTVKPTTSSGTGTVTRKSTDTTSTPAESVPSSVSGSTSSKSTVSSPPKTTSSVPSKPSTSSGVGSVKRK